MVEMTATVTSFMVSGSLGGRTNTGSLKSLNQKLDDMISGINLTTVQLISILPCVFIGCVYDIKHMKHIWELDQNYLVIRKEMVNVWIVYQGEVSGILAGKRRNFMGTSPSKC